MYFQVIRVGWPEAMETILLVLSTLRTFFSSTGTWTVSEISSLHPSEILSHPLSRHSNEAMHGSGLLVVCFFSSSSCDN